MCIHMSTHTSTKVYTHANARAQGVSLRGPLADAASYGRVDIPDKGRNEQDGPGPRRQFLLELHPDQNLTQKISVRA